MGKEGSEKIELLLQDDFPAVVEGGDDRYNIDGKFTPKGLIGYEEKDKWYVYRAVSQIPSILDNVDQKLGPKFKKRGYRGAYSTEDRINKAGVTKLIDLTCRIGSASRARVLWNLFYFR